jgi:hypothetical protein
MPNNKFKRDVRARMERTGESYTAALRAVSVERALRLSSQAQCIHVWPTTDISCVSPTDKQHSCATVGPHIMHVCAGCGAHRSRE